MKGVEDIVFIVNGDSIFGKNEIVSLLAVLPILMREVVKSLNKSA